MLIADEKTVKHVLKTHQRLLDLTLAVMLVKSVDTRLSLVQNLSQGILRDVALGSLPCLLVNIIFQIFPIKCNIHTIYLIMLNFNRAPDYPH